jgi:predicted glycoside hydrolase/deacetylase ChbG (UPF0249 family)
MDPNPLLRALGFAETDRVAIVHADDIGMCQASVAAFAELADAGLVTSGAVMMPCGWAPAAAAWARAHPAADIGVHLTLTSEWDAYRWGPLSTRDPASGLLDAEGYFPRTTAAAQAADPEAAARELEAQVARALAAGIDVTHVDTHMGAVNHPRLIPAYLETARRYGLPPMVIRHDEAGWRAMGLDAEAAAFAAAAGRELEAAGVPLLDGIGMMPLDSHDDRVAVARRLFAALPAGVTHVILHPAIDTPELRAIAPDWRSRVADYQAFLSRELRDAVRAMGIQLIGYRPLRDLLRATRGVN